MEALTEALKVLTSEEARDTRDTLAAATALVQKSATTTRVKTSAEMGSVFQLIMGKIDDFVSALESQTTAIQTTIKTCEEKSREALENLRDTAVYYDEEQMKRDNAQELIDTKWEKVEKLTKKTGEEMENLKDFEDECDEEVTDLTELKGKQSDVKLLIEQAFEKLRAYPDAEAKFKTIFALFDTELTKAQGEIDKLQGEIDATNTRKSDEQARVGVPPSAEGLESIGKCEDDIAVCAGKETVLCDLRTNIDDLCTGINTEEGKKTDAAANMGTASTSLDSMMGAFADTQPGCDTPMINGPAQIQANAKEIDQLKQAKTVLASYDTQDIGQGANYTDTSAALGSMGDSTDANWDAAADGGPASMHE
jgi:chromosome segregation ATPase